jgi:hypothetical protein
MLMTSNLKTTSLSDSVPPDPTHEAVSLFWSKRADQIAALADGGVAGGAARSARHMNGIRDLVRRIFIEAGMPDSSIVNEPFLPGYYRARKVGSVGKNINNRFEEALGTATDTWAAQTKIAAYGDLAPWLAYVFVLREDKETEKTGRSTKALFPTDPEFSGMSYNERYQEMLRRFLGDNVYQAGWFITTRIDANGRVTYSEPLPTATGKAFRTAVDGRVRYVKSVLD